MKTVLITGGTGLVGSRLTAILQAKGYAVRYLSRRRNLTAAVPAYAWDYTKNEIDEDAVVGVSHIIHLAGANVAGALWTAAYKQEIIDSRVATTALLARAIQNQQPTIESFVAASAVGYYGDVGSTKTDETGSAAHSFLGDVCVKWEQSVQKIANTGIRTNFLRIGIVLSTQGGALQKLLPTYSFGIGSYFGNGEMFTPWIHLDDLCAMFITAMENDTWQGVYNACAPEAITSRALGKAVGIATSKPNALLLPAPAFALRFAPGGMGDMLLCSSRIVPKRALAAGFVFQFTDASVAIKDLLDRGL
jgi:uncharacterized protein